MVLKPVVYEPESDTVTAGELMVFIGDSFVVTVRHGEGTPLSAVRERLEARARGAAARARRRCCTRSSDAVVDHYIDVAAELQTDLEELEAEVFAPRHGGVDTENTRVARIYSFKRQVLEFRRATGPLARPMARLAGARGAVRARAGPAVLPRRQRPPDRA